MIDLTQFQPETSQVTGITVYKPRPAPEKDVAAPTTYACPQCGAQTRFDVTLGSVACEHCGYIAAAPTIKLARAHEQMEFTLETLAKSEKGWGVTRREMHCAQCNADLTLPEGALSVTCPFCASNQVNVREAPADTLRPRFIIPFKILPEALKPRAAEWLGRGWFHPDTLKNSAAPSHFVGVYLPFWVFAARIHSAWKAEVGYERQESYYDSEDKEWKTRTVIDWQWEEGQVTTALDNWLTIGTSKVSRAILSRLLGYDLRALQAYNPDFLAGWQAQAYDITLLQAWDEGKAAMREKARQDCRAAIASSHVRNFSMVADFADETWRYALLPVYVSTYKFEGKTYQVLVNGQTGHIEGQKPVAWWKVYLAIALMFVPGVCAGLIGFPLLLAGGVGMVPLVIALIALIAAGIGAYRLYQNAVRSESV